MSGVAACANRIDLFLDGEDRAMSESHVSQVAHLALDALFISDVQADVKAGGRSKLAKGVLGQKIGLHGLKVACLGLLRNVGAYCCGYIHTHLTPSHLSSSLTTALSASGYWTRSLAAC